MAGGGDRAGECSLAVLPSFILFCVGGISVALGQARTN